MTQSKIAEALRRLLTGDEAVLIETHGFHEITDARAALAAHDAQAAAPAEFFACETCKHSGVSMEAWPCNGCALSPNNSGETDKFVRWEAAAPAVQAEQPMGCPCDPKATDGARCPDPKTGRCLCDPLAAPSVQAGTVEGLADDIKQHARKLGAWELIEKLDRLAALAAREGQPVAGWKLVPVEPTPDMLQAALEESRKSRARNRSPLPIGFELWAAEVVYRALLAASPTPPASQEGV